MTNENELKITEELFTVDIDDIIEDNYEDDNENDFEGNDFGY